MWKFLRPSPLFLRERGTREYLYLATREEVI